MLPYWKRGFPARWRLQNLRIGVRLRLAFACVILLMLLGGSLALWQFHEIRKRAESVSLVEHRMTAILQLDNSVLTMMSALHRAADTQQLDYFEIEANRLLTVVKSDADWVTGVLHNTPPESDRQAVILQSLISMLQSLPARTQGLIDLARSGDWAALHARILNHADHTDDIISALVQQIDEDLAATRKRLLEDIQRAQRRAFRTLAASGILVGLMSAALLGIVVTRTITRPLAGLVAGARALSQGDFGHQVAVIGNDELAHLATVFNRTILELRDLYTKMRLSEARFRSLIEKASDLIVVVSGTGELLYASPSSARVLGYPAEMLVGKSIRDLVDPGEAPNAHRVFSAEPSEPGAIRQFELRFRHQDGSYRVLEGIASNFLSDPAVAGILVNAHDVTERRKAEQELLEREDQLLQAQKMEAVGRLAGGIAHDFNNLLTVIDGYSDVLLTTLDSGDPSHGYAKEIRDAGERAVDLTRQLLAFSRRQVIHKAVLNLNDIVRDTEKMLRRVIGEDVELVCKLDPGLGEVEADPNQLRQVLMNLSVNARDAMPRGGRLTIETANLEYDERSNSQPRPDPCVLLVVSDTGHGMDEATRQRIFEPFFTTKEQGKGTGLGLSIVYGIITQSGGRISVHSSVGEGTTFQICLPRVQRTATVEDVSSSPHLLEGTETILLVEDQAEVRRFAATSLRSFGYDVIEAPDGEEALRQYQICGGRIQVLLTDVVMPRMTGVELSKRVQSMNPGVKVIFTSGYADSVILRHGALDTGAKLLQKPYSPAALAAKVREVLGPPPQSLRLQ